jgi:hypothetical protein
MAEALGLQAVDAGDEPEFEDDEPEPAEDESEEPVTSA